MTKVFVSGCFDLLHSGHIAFLEEASSLGDLYVSIGSDKTVRELKKKEPIYNEKERLLLINSLEMVKKAFIARGNGKLDFEKEIKKIKPDILFVNKDGDCKEKRELCDELDIEYRISKRKPKKGLPKRSSSSIRENIRCGK